MSTTQFIFYEEQTNLYSHFREAPLKKAAILSTYKYICISRGIIIWLTRSRFISKF